VDREGDISLRKSGSRKGGIFVDLRTGGDEKLKMYSKFGWRHGDKFTRTPDFYGVALRNCDPDSYSDSKTSRRSYLASRGKNSKENAILD
jgi:hypothetical protein